MNPSKYPVDFTIHYSDGTRETFQKGLVVPQVSPQGVVAHTLGLTVGDFLTILAALEGNAKDIVNNSQ